MVGILTTQQKVHLLAEKVAPQETFKYLDQLQAVLTTPHLFAVEQVVLELQQAVLETVLQAAPLVGITVRQQPLLQESVLETTFKVRPLKLLITITATLPLAQLQQLMLVRLLWVLVVVRGLPLAQGITAIQVELAAG